MKIISDIVGRIRNFNLPSTDSLIPLYEAISNSIQAIEENKNINGKINITVNRYEQTGIKMEDYKNYGEIDSFIIEDNGVGLDENNFNSFMQSDSTYKYEKGGKGIGRFTWLKAFEYVDIESCFKKNNEYFKRNFKFSLKDNDIPEDEIKTDENSSYTIIKLNSYKSEYRKHLPKRTEDLVESIIEYFFTQLLSEKFPDIIVNDIISDDNTVIIDIKNYFKNDILKETYIEDIKILDDKSKEYHFELIHIKINKSQKIKGYKVYLFAHGRMVEKEDLKKLIVDMNDKKFSTNDFGYTAIVKGKYFDDNVSSNRLEFNIPTNEPSIDKPLSKSVIYEKTTIRIKEYLKEYLEIVRNEKINKINTFIQNDAPQYRHLYKYAKEEMMNINPNLSDEKLDDELNSIKRKIAKEAKKEFTKFYKDLDSKIINDEDYRENLKKSMEKITDVNSSTLAEYVGHRKVIIEMLEKTIYLNKDKKYNLEEEVHNIIYPMRTDSDSQSYENHNLWLIDEKLAYCEYISSDIPFNNSPKEGRPDILMLDDTKYVVSDSKNEGKAFENIIIFELKRPMRDDYYQPGDTPTLQMLNYIKKLKGNKVKDRNGRPILVNEHTRYFLYAVCDITPSLAELLDDENSKLTIDKMGYYRFHDKYNAYIEVISYDKLINDAKKRNRVFFDKLGIL